MTVDKRMSGSVVTSQVVYAWDAAGNRTSVTRDGVTVVSTYNTGDRLATVGWAWSEERHASQRACAATTTARDRTSAGPPARVPARRGGGIVDDGAGFGIPRGADGAEVGVDALSGSTVSPLYTFWRSAAGEPVATEDGDGLHREVWGNPGADLPLAGDGPEGDWLWIAVDGVVLGQLRGGVALGAASDPLGSIAYYDGALAGVSEAFGEGSGVSDVRHGWAGMETLAGTPYQLAQHRLYDTANGRFTTADPIGLAGGDHRYAYGGGDPVQFVDPSGLAYAAPGSTALSAPAAKRSFEQQGSWQQPSPFAELNEASAAGRDAEYLASLLRLPAGYDREQGMPCVGPHCGRPDEEGDGTGTPDPRRPVLSDTDQERGLAFDPDAQRASIGELLTELWGVVTGTATEAELSGRNSALVVVVADRVVAPAVGGTGAVGGRGQVIAPMGLHLPSRWRSSVPFYGYNPRHDPRRGTTWTSQHTRNAVRVVAVAALFWPPTTNGAAMVLNALAAEEAVNARREGSYPSGDELLLVAGIGGGMASRGGGPGLTRVGRWMSEAEHEAMVATGRVQESTSLKGVTSVSAPPNPEAWVRQTSSPRYVDFDVPSSAVRPPSGSHAKIYGPNSMFGPPLNITEMPPATDIVWSASKVPQ